jgi:hypothetical protein
MTKYKMICKHCQSDNITQVCDTRWNFDKQQWIVSDTWNNFYCHDCDNSTNINKLENIEV